MMDSQIFVNNFIGFILDILMPIHWYLNNHLHVFIMLNYQTNHYYIIGICIFYRY